MVKSSHTPYNELSELIVKAISEEHFFSKEVLIPKVRAIIKGFNLNLNKLNYNKIDSEPERIRRLLQIEIKTKELIFWKQKCLKHLPHLMDDFYKECDDECGKLTKVV